MNKIIKNTKIKIYNRKYGEYSATINQNIISPGFQAFGYSKIQAFLALYKNIKTYEREIRKRKSLFCK